MDIKWNIKNQKVSPPGIIVTVNNHKMHMYKNGTGTDTIVFMAGGGTCCPTLDFKPLWGLLSKKFTIVVVEKAGYGWSESAKVARDIDTILNETRAALKLVGLQPPYILMPHSMSGIEALAWATYFPNEIKAIIGLDAALPECYDQLKPSTLAAMVFLYRILSFSARAGLLRFATKAAAKPIIASGQFSNKEILIYRRMFIDNSFTANMIDEIKCCRDNAQKVKRLGYPEAIPYLSFISDGKEIGIPNWCELLMGFVPQMQYGEYIALNCGHYVHHHQPEMIALETEKFLKKF